MRAPSPEALSLFFALQDRLRLLLPEAQEHIKSYGIAYTLKGPRRNRIHSICHITVQKDGVQLGFIRGHLLNHPGLRSDGNTYKRSLILKSMSEFDTDTARLVRDAELLAQKIMDEIRIPAGGKAPSLKPV